jgi:hypothetical protein
MCSKWKGQSKINDHFWNAFCLTTFLSRKILKLSAIMYFHVENPKKVVAAQHIVVLGMFQGIDDVGMSIPRIIG